VRGLGVVGSPEVIVGSRRIVGDLEVVVGRLMGGSTIFEQKELAHIILTFST